MPAMTSGAGYHAAKLNQPAHKLKLICFGDMMPPGGSLLLDAVRERRKSDLSSVEPGPRNKLFTCRVVFTRIVCGIICYCSHRGLWGTADEPLRVPRI